MLSSVWAVVFVDENMADSCSLDDSLTVLHKRADRLSEELQNLNSTVHDIKSDDSISYDIEQVLQKYSATGLEAITFLTTLRACASHSDSVHINPAFVFCLLKWVTSRSS